MAVDWKLPVSSVIFLTVHVVYFDEVARCSKAYNYSILVNCIILFVMSAHSVLAERGVCRVQREEAPIFTMERDLGRLVVFGHGGMNTVAMTVLLGMPCVPWEWERFALGHAAFIRLKAIPLGPGYIFSMRSFNDSEHLPKELRTI